MWGEKTKRKRKKEKEAFSFAPGSGASWYKPGSVHCTAARSLWYWCTHILKAYKCAVSQCILILILV